MLAQLSPSPPPRGKQEGVTLEVWLAAGAYMHLPFTARLSRMTDSIKEVVPSRQVDSPRTSWHPASPSTRYQLDTANLLACVDPQDQVRGYF